MASLELFRGDRKTFKLTCTTTDVNGSTSLLDLTGAKLYFTAKNSKDDVDGSAVISADSDTGSSFTTTDPTTGITLLSIFPDDTDGLTITGDSVTLFYDVQVKYSATEIYTVSTGTLTIYKDVTQRNS